MDETSARFSTCDLENQWHRDSTSSGEAQHVRLKSQEDKAAMPRGTCLSCSHFRSKPSSCPQLLHFIWHCRVASGHPDQTALGWNWTGSPGPVTKVSSDCRNRPEPAQCKAWKTHSTRSGPHPWHCHLVQPLPAALGGEGHALDKEIASVTQSLFSLDSNMHYSGWYPELPSELLGISIMRWQLMELHLPARPCKLPLLLSVNLHLYLLTAFNSKLRKLLESFCLQNWNEDHLYDINCIIKSVRSDPYLITHFFQAETVNLPLSAFNPQNICTLAVRFVSAK